MQTQQDYAVSIFLTALITYIIVWLTLHFSADSLLYYRHEDRIVYLPVSPNLIWQVSLFVSVAAAFAAAVAFF